MRKLSRRLFSLCLVVLMLVTSIDVEAFSLNLNYTNAMYSGDLMIHTEGGKLNDYDTYIFEYTDYGNDIYHLTSNYTAGVGQFSGDSEWEMYLVQIPGCNRTGYTFDGYYVDTGFFNAIAPDDMYYQARYGAYYGSRFMSVSAENNRLYTDGCFYVDVTGGELPTVELTAKYTPIIYKKTLDNQGADTAGTSEVYNHYQVGIYSDSSCTQSISKITIPTKANYRFGGYYDRPNGEGTKRINSNGDIIFRNDLMNNSTLYAYWYLNTYEITFDADGGFLWEDSDWTDEGIMLPYDSTIIDSANGYSPTKTGYTFNGWYTGRNGTGKKLTSEDKVTTEVTYYAYWTPINYHLTLNGNGGSFINHGNNSKWSLTYNYNQPIASNGIFDASEVKREGYTFKGWYTEPTGGTLVWNGVTDYMTLNEVKYPNWTFTNDMYLYAQWDTTSYRVQLEGNGGYLSSGVSSYVGAVNHGTDMLSWLNQKYPSPTRTGYTFDGWYTASSGGTKLVSGVKLTTDVVYYAHWSVTNYTISYNLNSGTISGQPTSYNINTASFTLPTPTRTGYTFTGWTGTGLSGLTKTVTVLKGSTGARSYTANWKINQYILNFDERGGSTVTNIVKDYNQAWGTLPSSTLKGYTFGGWYTNTSFTTNINSTDKATSNITAYAKWSANTYHVYYNGNGATSNTPATQSFLYNSSSKISSLVPIRNGYTFVNWKFNDITLSPGATIPSGFGDFTLTAQWSPNTYTLTYNTNNGSVSSTSKKSTYGSSWGTLAVPTRLGYTFKEWNTSVDGKGTKITSDSIVSGNLTVYAIWTLNTVRVEIPQSLIGDENGNCSFSVSSDLKSGKIEVSVPNSIKYSQVGKTDINGAIKVRGTQTSLVPTRTSLIYDVSTNGLSAGSWKSVFNISITFSDN